MSLPVTRTPSPVGRWDPLREFDDLQQRMNQLVTSVFGGTGNGGSEPQWTPFADLTESEDAYLVEVELPGVKREDISVEVRGNELCIAGELKEKERVGWLRSRTRRVGHFEYRTLLPRRIDSDHISAELTQGVLSVRVPKSEADKPKR
ncbi:MAG TPA: Hsp20/alpha crystallin family protein, partial [Cryptosporangiaceae bacterium]|nr:Hsp20/alpha crystallin family protein [Cryptosporangiaceae bacterium]